MTSVAITNRQRSIKLNTVRLRRQARRILLEMGFVKAEVSLAFIDDAEMRLLNRAYRRRNETTDVLAFAMTEGPFADINPQVLGDVVISAETALEQAKREGRRPADELVALMIHGLLHLLGYDHERSRSEARVMRSKERRLKRLLEEAG